MAEVTMKVAIRVRPRSRCEMKQNQKSIIRVMEDASTLIFNPDEDEDKFSFHGFNHTLRDITKKRKKMIPLKFDNVFHDETCNQDVFEICAKPIVRSVLDGFNSSIFAYGASGSGKTFTMLGNENVPGISFLVMQELFAQMELQQDEQSFDIRISYLEVYNERILNLLTKSSPLKLREGQNGVVVDGLVLKKIHKVNELLDLLRFGNKNRTQHPSDANEESSKSHAIFQVHIRMTDVNTNASRTVKLSMIDLAGSESAQSSKGSRHKESALEGANINKSLIALGNCISHLANKNYKHIPYRQSNLTRILKDCLGQNCQTLMIANLSPCSYWNSFNTLMYASRAKKIKTTCKQNILDTSLLGTSFLATSTPIASVLKQEKDQLEEIKQLKIKIKERKIENEKQMILLMMKLRITMTDYETKPDKQCNKENDSKRKESGPRRRNQGSKARKAMKIQEIPRSAGRFANPLGLVNENFDSPLKKKRPEVKKIAETEAATKKAETAKSAKEAPKVEKVAMVKEDDPKASINDCKRETAIHIPKLHSNKLQKTCHPFLSAFTVIEERKFEFQNKLVLPRKGNFPYGIYFI